MPARDLLANILVEYRAANGITQEKFAEICGISVDDISLMERRKISPRLDTVWKIADSLDMSLSEFFAQKKDI